MEGNTYRTIVFEKFKDTVDAPNLATMMANTENIKDNEHFYDRVQSELTVHSFAEFLEQFSPDIYEVVAPVPEGTPVSEAKITYQFEQPKNTSIRPIKITDHAYYRMLDQCYEQKKESGKSNGQFFRDTEVLDMLMPAEDIKQVHRLRKRIYDNCKEIQQAKKTGELVRPYVEQLQGNMETFNRSLTGSFIRYLPLAIDDAERKLELIDNRIEKLEAAGSDAQTVSAVDGTLEFNAAGRLEFKELPAGITEEQRQEAKEESPVAALIGQSYDSVMAQQGSDGNAFVRGMLVKVYAPEDSRVENVALDKGQLVALRDAESETLQEYQALYKKAKTSFIDAMSGMIEKLLGMKVLFDHATVKGGRTGAIEDGVIVANCKVDDIFANDDGEAKFREYAKYMAGQTLARRIWFAVIPSVSDDPHFTRKKKAAYSMGLDNEAISKLFGVTSEKAPAKKEEASDATSQDNLLKALKILDEAKIMTIFSWKGNENNGFGSVTEETIKGWKKLCRDKLEYDHATLAYPNFTVVRERKIHLATKEERERLQAYGYPEDIMDIVIPAVYIDAAYTAAGIMIASQQPDFLETKGLSVDRKLPCVRVSPGNPDLTVQLATKFNRENLLQWSDELNKAVTQDGGFGFAFSSDALEMAGNDMMHTYVLCANTLKHGENGRYLPLENKMVEDYVRARCKGAGKQEKNIQEIIQHLKSEWTRAKLDDQNVNLVLRTPEENIEFDASSKTVKVMLNNTVGIVDGFDVVAAPTEEKG